MNYEKKQKEKAIQNRDKLFQDPGGGVFKKKRWPFILSKPVLNLWSGIREDALDYCKSNHIPWWDSGNEPTGHLLSSQIACINHLYFIRQRQDLATLILRNIDISIQQAISIDTGFVEFEKVGKERLGKEKQLTRGANCTSIDAMMLGENTNGKRMLFLIEWKYTESYPPDSKLKGESGQRRLEAYDSLLKDPECPIIHKNIKDLYYEPFYQLMRQTLLGSEMVKRKEYGAEDFIHLHIIPQENKNLKERITSPGLSGPDIEQAWKNTLRNPGKYVVLDPKEFLKPVFVCPDTKSISTYLGQRYWE